jgi:hypothetical protein
MSAQIDIDKVLSELKAIATKAANEEELKINAERVLHNEVLSKLGLQPGRYEYTFVSGGRADALYGHVLIEYKAPAKLSKPPDVAKAKEQLIGYIRKEAEVEDRYRLFLGVILCDKIAFVRYDAKSKDWPMRGPYDLNRETVLRLIEAIRGLRRKRLAVDELLRDFGPRSEIATKAVKVFYDRITGSKSSKARALFSDWKRLFSQVCAYSPEKLNGLETEYRISGRVDYDALLFSIHTYYALIMKLLGAEIAYLYGAGKWLKSYVGELEDAHMKGLDVLKTALDDLESGGVFRKLLNITNFMEGDYFSWYLEELDEGLAGAISDIANGLADYEPATPVLEPEYTRDLLKRLYQNLVPKKIRHDLGEYYTPDWLADLALNEVGLTIEGFERLSQGKNDSLAPLNLRVLDPACGSGTFLVLAMKRVRGYAEEHYLKDVLASYLLRNVVGFDLNPLAVLAARTNYLLAVADLFQYVKGSIEIPIYLSDSLLVEERATLTSRTYVIRTHVGEFQIPQSIVEEDLLGKLLEAVDRYVRLRYKGEDFEQVAKRELDLDESELGLAVRLYKTFLRLEEEGKNHVWTSIIKNAFAPLTITKSSGRFDFVVGNPPWINWESLPEAYRDSTKGLWDNYGLEEKTKGMGLGKVKRDMAMLFVARCFDRYLDDGGKFSFLIPFTTYKTQAGAGFRNYLADRCNVLKIHDLVELFPFEGAINRTSLIVIAKGGKTSFPVRCVMWHNPRGKGVQQESALDEVYKTTERFDMILAPVNKGRAEVSWMIVSEKIYDVLQRVMKPSQYRAFAGVFTGLNSVYFITVVSRQGKGILIRNLETVGKKKVKPVDTIMEPDLVYPLVRGQDHKKWYIRPSGHIVIPVDSRGETLPHSELKVGFPKTYQYFLNFLDDLANRGAEPFKTKLKPYREKPLQVAEEHAPPFYWLFNVGPSLAPYKVMWKYISGKISGKGEFSAAVAESYDDENLGRKIAVPNEKLMLIPFRNRDEAFYTASVLNSSVAQLIVMGYTIETAISTHVVKHVHIPSFDSENRIHIGLSELSKKAHELAKRYYERDDLVARSELQKVEEEVDKAVAQLYGIVDEELIEVRRTLAVLRGEEIGEEEAEEEPKEARNRQSFVATP